jgi:NAD(P)H-dependent flavin oxidoreductase YrpB (nitropropane dioxygenase family)
MGKDNDVKVAALLGTAQHAINQVKAGVDILVVSGTEAGGHCGSVSTMVLIPEVHKLFSPMVMSNSCCRRESQLEDKWQLQ